MRKQSHWRGGGRVKAKGSIDANYALYVYQMSMLLAFEYYSFSRNVRRDFLEDFKNAVINVKPDDDYTTLSLLLSCVWVKTIKVVMLSSRVKKMHALSQGGDEGEKILLCYGLLWKWALSFAKNCQGWMLFEQGEFFQQCLNTLCNPLAHLIGMSLKFAAIHTMNTLVRQPNIFRCEGHPYFQYKLGLIFS